MAKQQNFETYRSFPDAALIEPITETLTKNNIPYEVKHATELSIPGYTGVSLSPSFHLLINPSDFNQVDRLIEEITSQQLTDDPDYYLFSFSTQELKDIQLKPDEWSVHDVLLSRKLLNDRGINISQEQIDQLKEQRNNQLTESDESFILEIWVGYISAFLGGFLGILIGWHLWKATRVLPNGRKVYRYTPNARSHGNAIFLIAVIVLLFAGLLTLLISIKQP